MAGGGTGEVWEGFEGFVGVGGFGEGEEEDSGFGRMSLERGARRWAEGGAAAKRSGSSCSQRQRQQLLSAAAAATLFPQPKNKKKYKIERAPSGPR